MTLAVIGAPDSHRCPRGGSQAKIPEGAKPFTMNSTRQGSNDGELLYLRYTGCKGKRRRVQWDPQRVQLHPLHLPGYGPGGPVFLVGPDGQRGPTALTCFFVGFRASCSVSCSVSALLSFCSYFTLSLLLATAASFPFGSRLFPVTLPFPPRSSPVHVSPSEFSRFITVWFSFRFFMR